MGLSFRNKNIPSNAPNLLSMEPSNLQPQKCSGKRGIGWPWDNPTAHFPLYSDTSDGKSLVSWLFNWELWVPPGIPSGIEWIPTIRTAGQVNDILPFLTDISKSQPITHLLGFNEPEILDQANLSVDEAVGLWKEFVLPAKQKFGLRLGSPGMSSHVSRSKPWLDEFFKQLNGEDGVDILVVHWYGPHFHGMKEFLEDMYQTYKLPLWVNEFACSKIGNGETSEEEVLQFLQEAVSWLDETTYVERYAYYGNGQGQDVGTWVGQSNNFTKVAAGCDETGGRRLSKVGRFYVQTA
jgi:putative glycosyl hydrolase